MVKIALLLIAVIPPLAMAAEAPKPAFYQMTRPEIAQTLKRLHAEHPKLDDRIEIVSRYFLGTPYKLGPMGEGETGEFDRKPLYNFKELDCTTYIEEVMALSLEPDLDKALQSTLPRIRYKNGTIGYETRNHFPETDWIANNIAAGFLKDITQDVAGSKTRLATKLISKRQWYLGKSTSDLAGFDAESDQAKAQLVKKWRSLGEHYSDIISTLPYLPIEDLPALMDRIPSGAISNLVRADLPGKPVMVTHQELLIRENGALYVRQASYGRFVEDIPILDYFKRYEKSKWPLLGLNLNSIRKP